MGDTGVRLEFFRRQGQRVERGDQQARAVASSAGGLLDQRAGERLTENALGQAEAERLAFAFVTAVVLGGQRHHDFGAGPGMIGQILDGSGRRRLRCAPAAPQAGNPAGHTADAAPRRRRGAVVLAGERGVRLAHPVIVLELIQQQHR